MRYSSDRKHGSPPKLISIPAKHHILKWLVRRTQYLFEKNVSFWVFPWEFLSFTQEWIFVFKLMVLLQRLTLLVWRIKFKSTPADKVFVLPWDLTILLRRMWCLYWVLLKYWKDWFSSSKVNYTDKESQCFLVSFFN